MDRYSAYDDFAWLYNQEWASYGNSIFPVLKEITGDSLSDGAKILDLCCGTGQLAKVLLEKGYRVTGIDGSEEMLRFARENAPAAEFILDDARTFRLPQEYNAVFSTFDALNHVMTLEELGQVFKNVNKCLTDGGIFIFDLNMQKHFETRWKNGKDVKEKPGYLYILRPDYDAEKRLGQFKCTIFQPNGKNWKRSDIVLCETFYPREDIEAALVKADFVGIRTYSFYREHGLQEVTEETPRIFFYAQKP